MTTPNKSSYVPALATLSLLGPLSNFSAQTHKRSPQPASNYFFSTRVPVFALSVENNGQHCKVWSRVGLERAHYSLFILLWYCSLLDPPLRSAPAPPMSVALSCI